MSLIVRFPRIKSKVTRAHKHLSRHGMTLGPGGTNQPVARAGVGRISRVTRCVHRTIGDKMSPFCPGLFSQGPQELGSQIQALETSRCGHLGPRLRPAQPDLG